MSSTVWVRSLTLIIAVALMGLRSSPAREANGTSWLDRAMSAEFSDRGSPARPRTRQWLIDRLRELGTEPQEHRFSSHDPFESTVHHGVNLIVDLPGKDHDLLVLTAHYDSHQDSFGKISPGADDNASGVAALLELIERFRYQPLRYGLRFIFFDLEERSLSGSVNYLHQNPSLKRMRFNINLDMIGYDSNGDGLVAIEACNDASSALKERLRPHFNASGMTVHEECRQLSDHRSFLNKGIPAVLISEPLSKDYNPCHHQHCDTADLLNPGFYSSVLASITSFLLEFAVLN